MHGQLQELLRIHHVSIKLEEALTFHSNLIPDMKVEHPTSATYHRQATNTKVIKNRQLSKAEDWSIGVLQETYHCNSNRCAEVHPDNFYSFPS